MAETSQNALLGLDRADLAALVELEAEPAYRTHQLLEAVYRQRVESVEQISTLPQRLRLRLAEKGFSIGMPRIEKRFVSQDGTVRYLIELADGESVETVWMPEGDGGEAGDGTQAGDLAASSAELGAKRNWDRATICISSQVGCAVDCQFCLTALLGVKRNLTVFMGMGEPFLNYENFMKAVRLLVEEVGVAESRMTVSTAGIVPRIHDFGQEPIRPKLAISLNAPNDKLRTQLMPLNRKWNLQSLMAAAREFPLRNRERITFEYVLLSGANDAIGSAEEVVDLLRGMRAKVNLIALNPGPGISFSTPEQGRVAAFQQVFIKAGIPAFVRRPRGRDIYAACGQLKRTIEIATAPVP
jgi:23S rRNA (adenine2503-C2)-methyltransferase